MIIEVAFIKRRYKSSFNGVKEIALKLVIFSVTIISSFLT